MNVPLATSPAVMTARPAKPQSGLRELLGLMRDPALFVWAWFVLLIPFYIFHSGLPQPGDLLVLPLLLLTLRSWRGQLAQGYARPVRVLLAFCAWVLIVDWGWAIVLGNFGLFGPDTFLLFPLYYVYNGLVFLVLCVLAQRHGERFVWLTLNAVFASVVIQCVASLVIHRTQAFRGIGFFNNPNQLGFFAVASASILALGHRRFGFGAVKAAIGLTLCLYLALLSASRAGVVAIGILFALMLISNPKRLIAASIAIVALLGVGGPVSDALEGTQQRLTVDRYPQYTFFEERGYDRITSNQEYWLLGAGEGGTERFAETTRIGPTEIHSSIGTLFFCYGVVGVALFGAFLFRVARGAPLRSILMLLPTITYTAAHQGLRSTSLWILFGVFVIVKIHRNKAAPT